MKTSILFLFAAFATTGLQLKAQDRIIRLSGDTISANVISIDADVVRFRYPNEETTYSDYVNGLKRIVFRSGRIQDFAQNTALGPVEGLDDWEKVQLTTIPDEIKGLSRIGDINSKARGATKFSNVNKVQNRAIRKLKMKAAMMGASIVFTEREKVDGVTGISPARTTITGVAYALKGMRPENVSAALKNKKLILTRVAIMTNNDLHTSPGGQLYEFTSEGRILIGGKDQGTYKITPESKIELVTPGAIHKNCTMIRCSNKKLIITIPDYNKLTSMEFTEQ